MKQRQINLVNSLQKTQFRRIGPKPKLSIGKTYVCSTTTYDVPMAEITVIGIWQERLGNISGRSIKAEGHTNLASFIAEWKSNNGSYDINSTVWVVEFKLNI